MIVIELVDYHNSRGLKKSGDFYGTSSVLPDHPINFP